MEQSALKRLAELFRFIAPTPLQRLAELCGIESVYRDGQGVRHVVAPEVLQALMHAMGIAADDEAALAGAIEEREIRAWRRALATVLVVRAGTAPIRVPISLPATRSGELQWSLMLESGERHAGSVPIGALPVLQRRRLSGAPYVRYGFDLPFTPGFGYHCFEIAGSGGAGEPLAMRLIVAPPACYQPAAIEHEGRVWGPSAPLYALRSRRNWGIGDFSDLRALTEFAAASGGAMVAVNALNAPFPFDPAQVDPYRPSSRLFLNILHLDVEAIADFAESDAARQQVRSREWQKRLEALRDAKFVDYADVVTAKLAVLGMLFDHFRAAHLSANGERGRAFRAFQHEGGEALRLFALHEALQEHFAAQEPALLGWPSWPEPYRDPHSTEVAAFAAAHAERVEFFQYLQWQTDLQLGEVGRCSFELHLGVGLCVDLPAAVARSGAEVWANRHLYAEDLDVAAPDAGHAAKRSDWAVAPIVPERLVAAAYEPFIAMLRRNMRHAGALRIDHLLAFMRQYWIPRGAEMGKSGQGSYVRYPFDDLLGIVALESLRNRCAVIADDFGDAHGPARDAIESLAVLSFHPSYLEVDAQGDFKPPSTWPASSLVAVGRYDMPTLHGFWLGKDLAERVELGVMSEAELVEQQRTLPRGHQRGRLLVALSREGLLPEGVSVIPEALPAVSPEMVCAIHVYLARTPARLMLVQLEDVLGQVEQASLPGSEGRRRNWQRKLTLELEDLLAQPHLQALATALNVERGSMRFAAHAAKAGEVLPIATRIPRATYRLQFNRGFTFAQAADLVPYLHDLGISHVYASPYLKARPGSMHGYDIVDHNALNPEIGSQEDFDRFIAALHEYGMEQMLDVVPNHMGIMYGDNVWWLDVLENGQASVYAEFFDIDWAPLKDELRGKVLVPVLGDQYGVVLERGELRLAFDRERGEFSIFYYEHRFPVDPAEYPRIISYRLDRLDAVLGADHPKLVELQSLTTAFGYLPQRYETSADRTAERNRDKEIHKRHLASVCAEVPEIAQFIGDNIDEINGIAGDAESFDLLHDIIKAQAYRLAYWRVASDDINYRRFFDVNDLAALKMERDDVFEATHRLVLDLAAQGKVAGLRIDHSDGLYDPVQYFERLQNRFAARPVGEDADAAARFSGRPIYLVIEKITAAYERVSEDWAVYGTTGYRFANVLNGLFIDAAAEAKMTRIYSDFIGERIDFDELLYRCKRLIMKVSLASELNVLANQLSRIALSDRHTCDFTVNALRDALAEIVACFPVYRTYVRPNHVSDEDRRFIDWAVSAATRRSQAADITIFDFVRSVLLTSIGEGKRQAYRDSVTAFAMKFQQFTGPVMAKGMEDTSFYRYNRLISLNEVGGDPRRFGMSLNAFHGASQDRAKVWPHTMLATSTHDSKRSEDVRARIDVLSEIPGQWKLHLRRWRRLNRSRKRVVRDMPAPSANDEYLLYQTLIGIWPLDELDQAGLDALRERIENTMLKVVREAKMHSSWINPDPDYEEAVVAFVRALLGSRERNLFLADFMPFQRQISRIGMFNSLSQVLIKLTAPGVPDIYQGNEIWDFSLVDPDNRRSIDFQRRRTLLEDLQVYVGADDAQLAARARSLMDTPEDGRMKLYVTSRTLALRRERQEGFANGDYLPLAANGACADNLCAFARVHREWSAITVAPRFYTRLVSETEPLPLGEPAWRDTAIAAPPGPAGRNYRNLFTGELIATEEQDGRVVFAVRRLLASFPVALLVPA